MTDLETRVAELERRAAEARDQVRAARWIAITAFWADGALVWHVWHVRGTLILVGVLTAAMLLAWAGKAAGGG